MKLSVLKDDMLICRYTNKYAYIRIDIHNTYMHNSYPHIYTYACRDPPKTSPMATSTTKWIYQSCGM